LPREVAIVTSDRSTSFKRVATDVAEVLSSTGKLKARLVAGPYAYASDFDKCYGAIVIMVFNTAHCLPFFFLARELKERDKKVAFYATVEGVPVVLAHEKWVLRDLSYVAVSNYVKRKLEEAGAKVDAVVYHGVDSSKVTAAKPLASKLRAKLGLSEGDFLVSYVAGGYPRKGHDLFAQVAKIVHERDKSIKFLVLTDSDGAKRYEGVPNAYAAPDFGKLKQEAVFAVYHASDLYAQASLAEGFGLPILEALAAGKPVVHADYDPLSEVTTPETSFRVPVEEVRLSKETSGILFEHHVYDPKAFADAILYAKDEVLKRREDLEAKCKERASQFEAKRVYSYFAKLFSR